jgi:hypothetical protein
MTQALKYAGVALAALVLAATIAMELSLHVTALDPTQPVTVTPSGQLLQGNALVGQFIPQNGVASAELPVPVNDSVDFSDTYVQVNVDTRLDAAQITMTPVSIQGTADMQVVRTGSSEIDASLPGLLADGHTILQFRAPVGIFNYPLGVRIVALLLGLTPLEWEAASGAIVLLALLYYVLSSFPARVHVSASETDSVGDISPLEIAILLRSQLHSEDIAAVLFSLAQRGLFQIIRHDDEILLLRPRESVPVSTSEGLLVNLVAPQPGAPNSLRQVLLEIDRELFSAVVGMLYVEVYDRFTERGYVLTNPRYLHLRFKTTGIFLQLAAVIGSLLAFFLLGSTLPYLVLPTAALYVIGSSVSRSGYHQLYLTAQGVAARDRLLSFSRYLANPQPFTQEQGGGGERLYRLLPYALVLGVAERWMARFRQVRCGIPSWFETVNESIYSPELFALGVEKMARSLAVALVRVKDPNVD